jgi:hypothetical protein
MGIAVFMILNQLKIAPAIVIITYAALMGSAALGLALAFGLGGREVAGKILKNIYENGLQDGRVTRSGTKQAARNAKRRAEELSAW